MEETINIDNAFIPDATTRDCYLRVTDICRIFNVTQEAINKVNFNKSDFKFITKDGKIFVSGDSFGCEEGYNFSGIKKIYDSLSLQQADILKDIKKVYEITKHNAYCD